MLVYKLYSSQSPDDFYVGSTEMTLNRRLICHRSSTKDYDLYKCLRQYPKKTWVMDVLEEDTYANREEMRKREEWWRVELRAPLNTMRAYSSPEEKAEKRRYLSNRWYQKNNETERKKKLVRYHANKDAINLRIRQKRKILKIQPLVKAAAARFQWITSMC
jgi:signal transduction histidine kinase